MTSVLLTRSTLLKIKPSWCINVTGGINVGIQSAGTQITTGVITAINFVGTGNTVQYDSSSKTVAVSIAGGGGGGGLGTAIKYSDETTVSPFSYIDRFQQVKEDMLLDTTTCWCKYFYYRQRYTQY